MVIMTIYVENLFNDENRVFLTIEEYEEYLAYWKKEGWCVLAVLNKVTSHSMKVTILAAYIETDYSN
jgi:hypothetical protein